MAARPIYFYGIEHNPTFNDVLYYIDDIDILRFLNVSKSSRMNIMLTSGRKSAKTPVVITTAQTVSGLMFNCEPWEVPMYLSEVSRVSFLAECSLANARSLRTFSAALQRAERFASNLGERYAATLRGITGKAFFFCSFTFPEGAYDSVQVPQSQFQQLPRSTSVDTPEVQVWSDCGVNLALCRGVTGPPFLSVEFIQHESHWCDLQAVVAVSTVNSGVVALESCYLGVFEICVIVKGSPFELELRTGRPLPFVIVACW